MKTVAIEFKSATKMYETLQNLGLTDYIISDENVAMVEMELSDEQFEKLCGSDDVVYASEL